MKPLYRRLFLIIQRCQYQLDRAAYALYMRAIDDELSEHYPEDDTSELAEPLARNVVHIPRRGLH